MIVPTPLIAIAAITLAAAGSLNPALAVVIVLFAAAVAAIGTVVMRFHNANMQRLCGRGVEVFPSAVALGKPRSASSYVAICRCNWTGHEQDTPQSAEVDAFRHANGAPVHVHAGPA